MRKYKIVLATAGYSRSASEAGEAGEAGEVAEFIEADSISWGGSGLQFIRGDRTVAMFTQFVYWLDVTDK